MTARDDRLWDLLRPLDDPEHPEFPPGHDHRKARSQFDRLVDRLDAAFSCACLADRDVRDTGYHGRIEVPAQATSTGSRLVVVVSSFCGLAVVTIGSPGTWSEEEFAELLHPDDASRIGSVLEGLGYTIVPEGPLWHAYDGTGGFGRFYPGNRPTWWIQFFDYL